MVSVSKATTERYNRLPF